MLACLDKSLLGIRVYERGMRGRAVSGVWQGKREGEGCNGMALLGTFRTT